MHEKNHLQETYSFDFEPTQTSDQLTTYIIPSPTNPNDQDVPTLNNVNLIIYDQSTHILV